MNSFKFEIATLTQTQGQTVCLTLQGVNRVFYSENSIWKSKRYGEELSPTWSSSVADPSHSPIERGQRHGPLRREKKEEEIINKINVIEINKLRMKNKSGNRKLDQLKGSIKCATQIKANMTQSKNQIQWGVDG